MGPRLTFSTTFPSNRSFSSVQHEFHGLRGRRTAERGQQCHTSVLRERRDVLVPVGSANEVDDHVDAFTGRDLLHLIAEILCFVVYSVSRAVRHLQQTIDLILRRGRNCDRVANAKEISMSFPATL